MTESGVRRVLRISLIAGLTAAVVEMVFVLPIQYFWLGNSPANVFQGIASGALGDRAFHEITLAVFLGLGVHTLVSVVSAAVFVVATLRWNIMRRHFAISGMVYGVLVYFVMTFVVIPLSAIGFSRPKSLILFLASFSVHIFAFGLPIALVCKALLKSRQNARWRMNGG